MYKRQPVGGLLLYGSPYEDEKGLGTILVISEQEKKLSLIHISGPPPLPSRLPLELPVLRESLPPKTRSQTEDGDA